MDADPSMPAPPKLSVVIPTMDRHALFAETLSTIAPQLSSKVELVVLDSSKDSQPVKEATQKAGGKYFWQNPCGFDQAYLDVVNLAQGEYIWLFGDDDLMKPHAIEQALEILETSWSSPAEADAQSDKSNEILPLDLLLVNADVIGADSSHVLKERCSPHPEIEFGADRSELVAKVGGLMSFMGSIIVRKAFWSQGAAVSGRFVGTRLITMLVPLVLPARRAHFIPCVLVSCRIGGHQPWMDTGSILIGRTMTDIIWSLEGIEDYAKQACTPRPPSWPNLLLWRALGQSVGSLPYFRARLVGIIPVSLTKWTCRTALRLLGKTNSMTGYTLGFDHK
jgi:glycosyltransferase involved in cell wall biosynthesis